MTVPHPRACCLALLLTSSAVAQIGRYELGLRLRAFERHLAQVTDAQRRDPAHAELERAVAACLAMNLPEVAAHIDAADRALAGGGFAPAVRYARSVQLQLAARLIDERCATLRCALSQLFETPDVDALPAGAAVVVHLPAGVPEQRVALDELPTAFELRVRELPVGDHALTWRIVNGDGDVLVERSAFLSVAPDLERRLAAVDRASRAAAAGEVQTIETSTLPALRDLLLSTQPGDVGHETVLRGDAMLREAEALAAAIAERGAETRFYEQSRPGDHTLRVPLGRSTATARLQVPEVPAGERRALVVALHGLFGSENLFFDGYGDGACVAQARRRGWFAVAPRNPAGDVPVVALVDALAERYAIDRERVYVVGHSMGAMAAMTAAARHPQRLRAVAAVSGGGGRVRRTKAFVNLPFLVIAGGRDFGRSGSRRLLRSLEAVGATAEWLDYPNADHFTVMQLSLPDVFAFFDRH